MTVYLPVGELLPYLVALTPDELDAVRAEEEPLRAEEP